MAAASMLRKFGFKKSEPRESEARLKLQKELFSFTKCVEHGFPHKPSSLAYDPKLRLLAIGTKTGAIRVFGQPGVEFSGQHEEDVSVLQLFFLPEQARLISVCSNNSLHLWEINIKDGSSIIEHVLEFSMEASKLKTISSCCLTADCEQLLMGTEGGNIHLLDTTKFQLNEHVIYQDVVMQNVPDDFKVNPGAVEAIAQHPTEATKFLIGYNRGLIVLWDSKENNAEQTYNATQQLESLAWQRDGTQFMSAHSDGSYTIWSVSDSTKPKEQATTPYGPFPCKAINKIAWKTTKIEPFIIFSGGMPRASYGDRHTVSVMQGNTQAHVVFEFTSRVVDFVTLCTSDETENLEKMEYDCPHSLLVLAEEELVALDLETEGWPCYKLPYLCSLHSSAITCAQHVGNIPEQLSTKVTDAGEQQMPNFSARDWPIQGGRNLQQGFASRDLLLTGHEDGSIRFWDVSSVSVSLLYKLQTMNIFGDGLGEQGAADADEEWPPFRKVGTFDPYSDDPRLAIQKIVLCPFSETLVVAGTAGQVVVFELSREEQEQEVKVASVNVVSDRDNFVWKGHKALPVKNGDLKFPAGFQPMCVVQVSPPAACTALALHPEWQLVAVGTAHGFGVFDYIQRSQISSKCTLNPSDLTGTGESAMSRRKSFKKSLRESFRRLRGRRSSAQGGGRRKAADSPSHAEEPRSGAAEGATAASAEGSAAPEGASAAAAEVPSGAVESPKPVERQVEARSTDDAMASMVRVLSFYDTFLINGQSHTPTLWAGTNAGTVYIYQITMSASDKRDSEAVQCQLAKEIQLKHHAPVISICVIDRNAQPLPAPLEVQHERVKAPDMSGSHQVLLCSEEQFKIFSLPSLKANNKYKLTAHEGSKVRRVGYVNFRSRSDERYSENDLVCLTNQGDIEIFTLPQLRRQLKESCIRKENVSGIVSNVFARNGEGYYLSSPSEFVRYSLSARFIPKPMCMVELKEGMRKPREEPPVVEVAIEAAAETQASGDADKLNESEKQDESALEPANDSLAAGDITADSVKIHITEKVEEMVEGCATKVEGCMTKTVVTKTTVVSESLDSAVTVTKETVSSTVDQAASAMESVTIAGIGGITARGANVDDDTKLSSEGIEDEDCQQGQHGACGFMTLAGAALLFTLHLHLLISFTARLYLQLTETVEPTDLLEELHITEEGDDDNADASPDAASTQVIGGNVDTAATENLLKMDIPKVVIVAPDDSSDIPNDDEPSLVDDVTTAVAAVMNNHDDRPLVASDGAAAVSAEATDNKTTVDGVTETTSNSVCHVSQTMS